MYVIIESGNKQYKLAKGEQFEVEKLEGKPGHSIKMDKVLFYSDGKKVQIGSPYLKNVAVSCDVIKDIKTKKVISFKYRRREQFRDKLGHRQTLTVLKVKDIKISD